MSILDFLDPEPIKTIDKNKEKRVAKEQKSLF
jgi:hypothetical protein